MDQPLEDPQLKALCHQHLAAATQKALSQFAKSLFPVLNAKNVFTCICLNYQIYYSIKLNKNVPFEDVTQEIYKKAAQVGQDFELKIRSLMSSEFSQKLKNIVLKAKKEKENKAVRLVNSYEESKTVDKNQLPQKIPKIIEKNTSQTSSKATVQSKQHHVPPPTVVKNQKNQPKKAVDPKQQNNNDSSQVQNLSQRNICLCGRQLTAVDAQKQNCFNCIHCLGYYHFDCMKKGPKARHCSLCHLRYILPNRQVKKTLFLGLLKKGRKKHELFIPFVEQDLSNRYKLQVRSFRIKESTQNFILFPDAVSFAVNSFFVKQFNPLHRQSSLKYRKDQPFYLQTTALFPKENKIVITQRAPSKDTKDDRIQLQNHLVGLFLVEEKKVDQLVKEIRVSAITQFYESKKLLDSCFRVGNGSTPGGDDITCEVVKIPLTCTLTIQKIKYPVRGVLCSHFQCFDLNNYLIMTSSSANPRWLCPLCKMPTYEFKLDCILLAILQEYKKYGATEVMFCIDGSYNVFADDKVIKQGIQTINQLPIESKGKRPPPQTEPQEDKKKKKKFVIPEVSNIISLDD